MSHCIQGVKRSEFDKCQERVLFTSAVNIVCYYADDGRNVENITFKFEYDYYTQ